MPTVSFTVEGVPLPQKRPRFVRHNDFVSTYDPDSKHKNGIKKTISHEWEGRDIITVPVSIEFRFFLKIPKSTSKKTTAEMLSNKIKHIKKPDIDNLMVGILNCMTKIVYCDDNQVHRVIADKFYSAEPRTEVFITWENS
jgi:Holliday junction resolvase RusA-like endonuclease